MSEPSPLMLDEALEAPARVADLLRDGRAERSRLIEALRAAPPGLVLTAGRGSSDHACGFAAWSVARQLGLPVMSVHPSLITREHAELKVAGSLALAISQSGRGADIVAVTEWARRTGVRTAAIVNDPASPLAAAAEFLLDQRAGPERSVAATKSVLCSMAVVQALIAEWSRSAELGRALESLPSELMTAGEAGRSAPVDALVDLDQAFVLGRGAGLPIAQEIALKLKETSGIAAEAFSAAEVRHGPREVVGRGFLVVALALPGPTEADVRAAAAELADQGASLVMVGEGPEDGWRLPAGHPVNAPLMALQLAYPAIARAALARGRDPDRPAMLAKVTSTL